MTLLGTPNGSLVYTPDIHNDNDLFGSGVNYIAEVKIILMIKNFNNMIIVTSLYNMSSSFSLMIEHEF